MDCRLKANHLIIVTCFSLLSTFISTISTQSIVDNRCYLEDGAASASFFISEDLPIGSTIGEVRVHGDPRPDGTIALRLREPDSPVTIAPASRNLTLRKRLDKEGLDGPSSVYINLICERLHTLDPVFLIPVNIRVTDANDNAPKFINAPYVLNISEVTVVGTRVLQGVHAIDADQQGPFASVRYMVLPGPHADFFDFENELEGTLVLRRPLDYETLRNFDVRIRAQDHGEPPKHATTVLTVNVLDADDQNPKFTQDRYFATLPEPPRRNTQVPVSPGPMRAFDQDLGINAPVYYTFNGVGADYALFRLDRNDANVTLARDLSTGDLQHPATLVVRATQRDNPDRYALATLTVSRVLGGGIRFLRHIYHVHVPETFPVGATLTLLSNSRPGEPLRYYVSDKEVLKTFSISPRGELGLKQRLDFEERGQFVFRVFATDGITNDSAVVNITVEDVNEWEPHFRYSHYEFFVADQPVELVGRIEVGDGDSNQEVALSLSGLNSSMFYITPNGEIKLKELKTYEGVANFAVTAGDNGVPPKTTTVPVIVHFQKGATSSSASILTGNGGSAVVLAGLGVILLILAVVIALLAVYIYKAKKGGDRDELPSVDLMKATPSTSAGVGKMGNPLYGDGLMSPTATAMGGLPTKTKPSPKVHPAPQPPPIWPQMPMRIKKLSWGDDKTDSESVEDLPAMEKLGDGSNLTVYF